MLKSKANDLIDNLYSGMDSDSTKYTAKVMEAAFKLKKKARKYIADAMFDTELYKEGTDEETGMEDLVPAGKLADYNMQFKALPGYDIMKTGYKYNFTKLRDSVYKAV